MPLCRDKGSEVQNERQPTVIMVVRAAGFRRECAAEFREIGGWVEKRTWREGNLSAQRFDEMAGQHDRRVVANQKPAEISPVGR